MILRRTALALFPAFALLTTATAAHATLIAQDSFSYPAGQTVNGLNGGSGWSGAWITGQSAIFTASGAIAGVPSIGQTGGAMSISGAGRIFRKIDLSAGSAAAQAGLIVSHSAMFFGSIDGIGAPGKTVWVGMLVGGGSGNPNEETQYHLYDGARTDSASLKLADLNKDGEVVAMMRGGGLPNLGFERTCAHSTCVGGSAQGYWATNPKALFGGSHWSVTRYVFNAASTDITLWWDPAPGATPPDTVAVPLTPYGGGSAVTTTSVPPLYFDTIAPNADGNYNYQVDEIRIGTTFADLAVGGAVGGGGGPDAGGPVVDGGGPVGTSDGGVLGGDGGVGVPGDGVSGGSAADDSGCACDALGAERGNRFAPWGALALALTFLGRTRSARKSQASQLSHRVGAQRGATAARKKV